MKLNNGPNGPCRHVQPVRPIIPFPVLNLLQPLHTESPKGYVLYSLLLFFQQAWISPAVAVSPCPPQRCFESGSAHTQWCNIILEIRGWKRVFTHFLTQKFTHPRVHMSGTHRQGIDLSPPPTDRLASRHDCTYPPDKKVKYCQQIFLLSFCKQQWEQKYLLTIFQLFCQGVWTHMSACQSVSRRRRSEGKHFHMAFWHMGTYIHWQPTPESPDQTPERDYYNQTFFSHFSPSIYLVLSIHITVCHHLDRSGHGVQADRARGGS